MLSGGRHIQKAIKKQLQKKRYLRMYIKKTVLNRCDDIVQVIKSKCISRQVENREIFTDGELNYCARRVHCLGARFMIKECVLDYLESQTGHVDRNYREIEIIHNEFRKPTIRLFDGVDECVKKLHIKDIIISVSHSRMWIAGMVLFCYQKNLDHVSFA